MEKQHSRQSFPIKHSITSKVLSVTFLFYFCFTFLTTILHMVVEYHHTEDKIRNELKIFSKTIEGGIAESLWNVDEHQLYSLLYGALNPSYMVGIRVEGEDNKFSLGYTEAKDGSIEFTDRETRVMSSIHAKQMKLIEHSSPLTHLKKTESVLIGTLTLYSSSDIVFDDVKYGFVLIIINAILKTFALWFFFLVVGNRYLSKPLQAFIHSIDNLTMKGAKLQKVTVQTDPDKFTEIDALSSSFNTMVDDLDIAQSKIQETTVKLLYSQLRLNKIIDAMPSAIIGVDEHGRVTDWNLHAEEITGIKLSDAFENKIHEVYPHFKRYYELSKEALKQNKTISIKRQIMKVNEVTRYFDVLVYPVIYEDFKGAVIRIEDVTEWIQAEQRQNRQDKLSSVGHLASAIAKEVLDPLGVMVQASQNIKRRLDINLKTNQSWAEQLKIDLTAFHSYLEGRNVFPFLDEISEASQLVSQRLSNIAKYSVSQSLSKEKIHLTEFVPKIVHDLKEDTTLGLIMNMTYVAISCEVESDLPSIQAIPILLNQVFMELFKNSVFALRKSSGPKISIQIRRIAKEIEIIFSDTGEGMTEEVLKHCLEPFYTTKASQQCLGIGLALVHQTIVTELGGRLQLESKEHQGCLVRITLPIHS